MKAVYQTIAIVLLALSLCFISCTPKFGCATEKDVQRHDRKQFRVMRIKHVKGSNAAYVYAWHYQDKRELYFECLPDSIKIGKHLYL